MSALSWLIAGKSPNWNEKWALSLGWELFCCWPKRDLTPTHLRLNDLKDLDISQSPREPTSDIPFFGFAARFLLMPIPPSSFKWFRTFAINLESQQWWVKVFIWLIVRVVALLQKKWKCSQHLALMPNHYTHSALLVHESYCKSSIIFTCMLRPTWERISTSLIGSSTCSIVCAHNCLLLP